MSHYYINGINWKIIQEKDSWYSIYKIIDGKEIPIIQAKDLKHAEEYIYKREVCNFPINKLC